MGSSYVANILPHFLFGLGVGLILAPGMSTATAGIAPADAGVGSASVNTMQQIGGSIGAGLLSSVAASAATDYLAGKNATPDVVAHSASRAIPPPTGGPPPSLSATSCSAPEELPTATRAPPPPSICETGNPRQKSEGRSPIVLTLQRSGDRISG
jgi:hypothetical protein